MVRTKSGGVNRSACFYYMLTLYAYSMKSLWRSWVRDGMMHFTGLYFAVLGGAYSSLAKANSRYVSNKIRIKLPKYISVFNIIDITVGTESRVFSNTSNSTCAETERYCSRM